MPTKTQLDTDLAGIDKPPQLQIRFNIAPTQLSYVIANDRPHQLQPMAWGLIPNWSRDGELSGKMINARAEGIADKPSFREPIRRRRCLVPADSFYEWRTEGKNHKVPYRILRTDGHLLMMAGIWDEWSDGRRRLRTFSIITTTPNEEVSALHDRMPVILEPAEQKKWLEALPLEEVLPLLHRPADHCLRLYRVSEKLNHAGYEGPELHEEVPEQPLLF